jgi:hypothetical protein
MKNNLYWKLYRSSILNHIVDTHCNCLKQLGKLSLDMLRYKSYYIVNLRFTKCSK